MKKILYITCSIAFCLLMILGFGCKPDNPETTTGNIYGIVTVKSTAEPMRATGVELNIKSETYPYSWDLVTKTVTYDDGHFEFDNIPIYYNGKETKASYQIVVDAVGYNSVKKEVILLAGQTTRMDMQLEEIDTYLTVRTLEASPSGNQVELKGTASCPWAGHDYEVNEAGFLYAKLSDPINTSSIKVKADLVPDYLGATDFSIIVKNLEKGSYHVYAYAQNSRGTTLGERQVFTINCYPSVKTLEASNITINSASLNASVIYEGEPAYTERGFVYSSKFENPSVDDNESTTKKVIVSGRSTDFSANITNLSKGETYYARAYLTNNDGTFYGAPITFEALPLNEVIVLKDINLMVQKSDMAIGLCSWDIAYDLCTESRVAGYSDWRLPTQSELSHICYNNSVENFTDDYYWCSNCTIYGAPYRIRMQSCSGGYLGAGEANESKVRAVRTITE